MFFFGLDLYKIFAKTFFEIQYEVKVYRLKIVKCYLMTLVNLFSISLQH